MDFNDIETMLRNNVATPEEIAKAFTEQLNAAIEATAKPTEWEKGIADLIDDWNYMIDLYVEEHPDETNSWEITDLYMTPKAMEDLVKASIDAYRMADNIVNDLNKQVYKNCHDFIKQTMSYPFYEFGKSTMEQDYSCCYNKS